MTQLILTAAIILGVVFLITYLKNTKKELRDAQISTAKDITAIGVVATVTIAKEIVKATVNSAKVAAKTVEAEHTDAVKAARQSVDNIIKDNGGTIKQAGVTLGQKASDSIYLTDANKALSATLKDLEAKGF